MHMPMKNEHTGEQICSWKESLYTYYVVEEKWETAHFVKQY